MSQGPHWHRSMYDPTLVPGGYIPQGYALTDRPRRDSTGVRRVNRRTSESESESQESTVLCLPMDVRRFSAERRARPPRPPRARVRAPDRRGCWVLGARASEVPGLEGTPFQPSNPPISPSPHTDRQTDRPRPQPKRKKARTTDRAQAASHRLPPPSTAPAQTDGGTEVGGEGRKDVGAPCREAAPSRARARAPSADRRTRTWTRIIASSPSPSLSPSSDLRSKTSSLRASPHPPGAGGEARRPDRPRF
ncbi:hypothetical protein BC628DRAFT_512265 [Trametes gibbosa]|nr:hypothetical protein BC628DRAFT_512265 [Trametes gibbosa]